MRRGHRVTTIVLDPACQEMLRGELPRCAAMSVRRELGLHAVPSGLVYDRGLLAIVGLPLVGEPPDVDRVGEDVVADAAILSRMRSPVTSRSN